MNDFIYYSKNKLDFPLSESIYVTDDKTIKGDFIISNSKKIDAEIIANEINFYVNNTEDVISNKIINIEKLYELNAIRFDMAQDISYLHTVSNKLLFICNDLEYEKILEILDKDKFNLFHIREETLRNISGCIGDLIVTVNDKKKVTTISVSQIIWRNAKEIAMQRSGCYDPSQSSMKNVLKLVSKNINEFSYKKILTYNSAICQYHERREDICARCVDVCPTVTIVKNDELKHLEFLQVDCLGCGGCISVCPSGALDYAPSNKESINEMAKFMNGHMPLIIPSKMSLKNLNVKLKENVLPFYIDGEKFLHEATLLTILQESGAQAIFYSDFISKGTGDAIKILNQVYTLRYGIEAIIIAKNKEELSDALQKVQFIENSRYTFNNPDLRKRELFAVRLKYIVGDNDLGEVTCGEYIHYGVVKVNEANCTLCLSCVGACNVDAIIADAKENTIKINPSLCTTCGYCEVSCPESDCLSIESDVIKLNPSWFRNNKLATDTLFACVECGKEFATSKAIEKIAAMMKPFFKSDPVKERTLYCCEDCKPKIMMKSYMENRNNYNNNTIR
jgi:MinD superfamily P-loop ATPase